MSATEDLFRAARAAYRLAMVGRTPFAQATWGRMAAPRPGDLVIEVTSMAREFDPDRVGILVAAYPRTGEWVVRPYDNQETEQRWANAEFVAVPGRGEGWPS